MCAINMSTCSSVFQQIAAKLCGCILSTQRSEGELIHGIIKISMRVWIFLYSRNWKIVDDFRLVNHRDLQIDNLDVLLDCAKFENETTWPVLGEGEWSNASEILCDFGSWYQMFIQGWAHKLELKQLKFPKSVLTPFTRYLTGGAAPSNCSFRCLTNEGPYKF